MKLINRILFVICATLFLFLLFTNSPPKTFKVLKSTCSPLPGRPSIQYALVIDCGSTGSRIHVYRFNYCKESPQLEDEVFEHTEPGLSSYKNPIEAAKSLDPLLKIALDNVPRDLYACTQVIVKATAGLRMLEGDLSDRILAAVKYKMESEYPFPIFEKDGVSIMGGDNEGVFAWITLNYLLGKIGGATKVPTAGIMDLGGGSTQIVYEPEGRMPEGVHRIDITFASHQYSLYQHSYDGYGLMQGRKRILEATVKEKKLDSPCISPGKKTVVDNSKVKVSITGNDHGLNRCMSLIKTAMFSQSNVCPLKPCSFEGVFMPKLIDHFKTDDLYAFSYFYDKFAEPFKIMDSFKLEELKEAANLVCTSRKPALFPEGEKEHSKNNEWCTDLSYMYSLLSTGYSIPDERILKTAKKIDGIEIGWALGAAIQMLDHQMSNPKFETCKNH